VSDPGRVCSVCQKPMTDEEWDERHSPHDEGCPGIDSGCWCDNEVHEACCWECSTSISDTDKFEILTDGITVWVNSQTGHTIGRFGKLGIDIHNATSDGCLYCTHSETTLDDWFIFVGAMIGFHGVTVDPRRYMPERFRKATV
jgi:hypothetical protein